MSDAGHDEAAVEYWEREDAESFGLWSGRVSAVVSEVATGLTAGGLQIWSPEEVEDSMMLT